MLEKSCKTCGCPLFEVKGKTLCVVCAERDTKEKSSPAAAAPAHQEQGDECSCGEHRDVCCEGGLLSNELVMTIVSLCGRIQNEKNPDTVLALMNAVKAGSEALRILCQL